MKRKLITLLFAVNLISPVYAASAAETEINKVINLLYKCIGYAGTIVALYAVGMIVLSFKSENHETISKHIMQLCIGVVFMGLKSFMA